MSDFAVWLRAAERRSAIRRGSLNTLQIPHEVSKLQGMELLKRHQLSWIERATGTFPVVALTGARQVGKSTLARMLLESAEGEYVTLDDQGLLSQAVGDPVGFVRAREGLTVLDEVQKAPQLLPAIKLEVDRDRRPGRFLLTGSANLLRMREVTESLAGRAAWLELPPLSWSELVGAGLPASIDAAFHARTPAGFIEELGSPAKGHARSAKERSICGGMPGLIGMDTESRRLWYDGYRTTFLERDLRQLSRIADLPAFSRLATMALLRTGTLLNRSALAADASLDSETATRYLNILEVAYQVFELTPYLPNLGKRLVKRPKLYARDVGMSAHAANVSTWDEAAATAMAGHLFETWVVNELLTIDSLSASRSSMHFWRTGAGAEVDLILERGTDVVAFEVKSAASVAHRDTFALRSLADGLADRFRLGIVAYLGDEPRILGDRLCAVPVASLLGVTR
jgi:hypothetical protein